MVLVNEIGYQINVIVMQMVEIIFGEGVQVMDVLFIGDNCVLVIYIDGDDMFGVVLLDIGVIFLMGWVNRFMNSNGDVNQLNSILINNSGVNNNSDFNIIVGVWIYDVSWLDVMFIFDGDFMMM